jgi:hypothetical protein
MFGTIQLRRVAIKTATIILAIVFLFGAASVSFAGDLAGCWKGCWRSDCTGHEGKLRATITRVDDTHYCANFSGDFWRIFPFRYSVLLTVDQQGDTLKLSGSKDLGPLIGTFSFDGSVTSDEFRATYISRRDRGEFNMTRVPPCGCCR